MSKKNRQQSTNDFSALKPEGFIEDNPTVNETVEQPVPQLHETRTLPKKTFPRYRVAIHSLNLREIPSKSGRIISELSADTIVVAISYESGDWANVKTEQEPYLSGFVMRQYLEELR